MKTLYTTLLAIICLNVLHGQTPEQEIILETHSTATPLVKQMDINADGNLEFIYVRANNLQVCQNTGDSSWAAMYIINENKENSIANFEHGDINNDGFEDIVFTSGVLPKKIHILINPTDNSANWEEIELTDLARTIIGVFDMNSDGWNDIVYENTTTTIKYYQNNAGTFTDMFVLYDPVYNLTLYEHADIDVDGDNDFIVHFNFLGTVFFKNNGDGTTTNSTITTDSYQYQIKLTDIDEDGYDDLFLRYGTSCKVAIFKPLVGNFNLPYFINYYTANDYDFGDIDNDGDEDLLLTKFTDDFFSNIYWAELLPEATFAPESMLFDSIMIKDSPMFYANYDDDAYIDVIGFINGNTHVFINHAGDSLSSDPINPDLSYLRIDLIRMVDINNDGADEIVVANHDATIAWINYNQTIDTIASSRRFGKITGSPYPKQLEAADCTNDGFPEVVVSYQGEDEEEQISYYFVNDGNGNFLPHVIAEIAFGEIFFTDVNEDGKIDFLGKEIDYPNTLKYYANTGDTANLFVFIADLASGNTYDYTMTDADNDGDMDFLIADLFSSYIKWIENINPGAYGPVLNFYDHYCSSIYNVYSADAEGDGDVDLYYTCSTEIAYFAENVGGSFVNNLVGSFEYGYLFGPGYNDQQDLNGDGFIDLILYEPNTDGLHIKLTEGGAIPTEIQLLVTTDYGIFTDFDGNGSMDVIGANADALYIQYDVVFLKPTVTVIPPATDYIVEGAGYDSILIAATHIPEFPFIVNLEPGSMIDAGNGVGNTVYLNFAADSTALDTQIIYLNVPDDIIVEDIFINNLILGSDDPSWGIYAGTYETILPIRVVDNELGIFASDDAFNIVENMGDVDYDFHLNVIPTSPVYAVSTTPNGYVFIGGSDTTLFDAGIAATYDAAGYIYCEGDLYPEPDYVDYIVVTLISDDAFVNGFVDTIIHVTLIDNDNANIFLTNSPTSTFTEGIEDFSFSFRPLTGLLDDVQIVADPDEQLDLGSGPGVPIITMFEASETVPSLTTIVGIPTEDLINEPVHYGYVYFSVISDNTFYEGFELDDLKIRIADNNEVSILDPFENAISIYPQSGNGNFTINWPQEANVQEIIIVNTLGQQIWNEKVNGNLSSAVNLTAPQGLYQVILLGAENQFVKQYLLTK